MYKTKFPVSKLLNLEKFQVENLKGAYVNYFIVKIGGFSGQLLILDFGIPWAPANYS